MPLHHLARSSGFEMQHVFSENNPWQIISSQGGEILCVGQRRISLRDVTGWSLSAHEERDSMGNLFNFVLYLLLGGYFLALVMNEGWRERFLLASALFFLAGVVALLDTRHANRIRTYRLSIEGRTGRIRFVTTSRGEADGLAAALRLRGIA